MATTIDYASDYENPSATIFHGMNNYGKESSDYQTTMAENPEDANDYRLCPIVLHALLSTPKAMIGTKNVRGGVECYKGLCAWWDADKSRCAVLSLARNK